MEKWLNLDEACEALSLTKKALRLRLWRASQKQSGLSINMGGGVTAIKLGGTWRIHMPKAAA